MKKSKKAESGLLMAVSIIAIVLSLVILHFFIAKPNIGKADVKITDVRHDMGLDKMIVPFLSTPTDKGTIADLLIEYYHTGNKGTLERETGKIIRQVYGISAQWQLEIGDKSISNYNIPKGKAIDSEVTLPLLEKNKEVTVRLAIVP